MGQGVDVEIGMALRIGGRAGLRLDDVGRFEMRRAGHGGGELGRELTEGQVLAAPLDQAEGGGVPEHGRSAVAEDDLIPFGEGEHRRQAGPYPAHHGPYGRPAVAGAHVRRAGGGQGGQRFRPDLGGAAAESAVGREAVGGDRNLGIALAHQCHYSTGPARIANPATQRNGKGHLCRRRPSRPRISTLVGAIAPSATLAIDAKARALRASGVKVVSYGAGEPDFATPDYIVAAAVEAAAQPASHHYTAVSGLQPLREAVAAKTARDSGLRSPRPRC